MTRAIQKPIARRQDQTFADWFAELRELAAAASRFVSFQIMFNRSRSHHGLNGGRVRPQIVLVPECPKTKRGDQANRRNT